MRLSQPVGKKAGGCYKFKGFHHSALVFVIISVVPLYLQLHENGKTQVLVSELTDLDAVAKVLRAGDNNRWVAKFLLDIRWYSIYIPS